MQTTLAQPQQKVNLDIISGVISWPGQPAVVQLKDGRNHNTTRDVIELIVSQAKAAGYRLVRGRSVGGFDLVAPKAPEPTPVKLGDKCIYPQTWEEMERERLESQWCEMWLTRDIERIKSSRAHRNPITGHFLGGDRGGH